MHYGKWRSELNMKSSPAEKLFDGFNYIFLTVLMVITLYPCIYVLMASVSDPMEMYRGSKFLLWPRGFSLSNYVAVFNNRMIWVGYKNTIIYVAASLIISVTATVTAAYCLSREYLLGKNIMIFLIVFTMYFPGGLIPTYLIVDKLNLVNTPWAILLPTAINTYNFIVTLSYFRSLPNSLEEAAKIDGASDYKILSSIMLPLAKPITAVISLYTMVGMWNNYFTPMIYLHNPNLYPLQLVLRQILIQNDTSMLGTSAQSDVASAYLENIKYATVVVATVPILCVYPFLQKYFIKGVMIGAIKE